ncbi:MAG TPA: beta-ketoacyl-ACP synthase III [Candidatus Obscuribacterales bacterium]
MPRAQIAAVATYVPENLLTNQDLEKLVDTTDQWIVERTGIKCRHIADKGLATSDLATEAARKIFSQIAIDPAEIELIVVATITPDMLFPATACLVEKNIGATNAWGFDLSIACSGFLFALQVGAQFVETGRHKNVLVIGADVMSSIVDYTDRQTCIIFGDGSGAALLKPAEEGSDGGIIDFVHQIDGSNTEALCLPAGGSRHPASHETVDKHMHYIHQDGQFVFKFATRKMSEVCLKLLEKHGLTGSDIDVFIPHQANLRIIQSAVGRMQIDMNKVVVNIDEYGNTTDATIPLAIETALRQGRLKKNDLVLMATMGAGFSAGASLVRWSY